MPGHDRAAGAKARHQHDLSSVRYPLLRRCRPDTVEADSHQSSFQRDQVQPGERNGLRGCGAHRQRPDRVRISVKDSGAGLPPEMLAQLFQPFNRLGQERSTEEGTGIGLVMSKRLVELMGGRDRSGQRGRRGQRILVRAERGRGAATGSRRRGTGYQSASPGAEAARCCGRCSTWRTTRRI